jgi:hypothetical protein
LRKLIAAGIAALALAGGSAFAASATPGPNDHNTHGLCTAYFSGSDRGQEMKHKAPPFKGLEAAADAADQSVEEYCAANGQRPGGK